MKKLAALLVLISSVALAQTTTHNAVLTWTEPTDSGVTFNVYKATGSTCNASPAPTFTKLNTSPITAFTYTDSPLQVGTIVSYYVTAVSGTAESTPSNCVSGLALPGSPQQLTLKIN